jgi:unsaturated chondroitin disaccharide hydrolase
MKKIIFISFLMTLVFQSVFSQHKPLVDVQQEFNFAAQQYEKMLATHPDITKFPQSTKKNGELDDRTSDWWCSGFFGGSLWYIYEFTKDDKWKTAADKWTRAVEKEKYNKTTHDLGFMLYCPYGNGYRLTKNKDYVEPMITGAKSLATRFDPNYGLNHGITMLIVTTLLLLIT